MKAKKKTELRDIQRKVLTGDDEFEFNELLEQEKRLLQELLDLQRE